MRVHERTAQKLSPAELRALGGYVSPQTAPEAGFVSSSSLIAPTLSYYLPPLS